MANREYDGELSYRKIVDSPVVPFIDRKRVLQQIVKGKMLTAT